MKSQKYEPLYDLNDSIFDKVKKIATKAYGASDVTYSEEAKKTIEELSNTEAKNFYVCMAKTPNSLSDDAKVIGRPRNFTINVKEVRVSTGAKFVICLTGAIMTMPGLSKEPMALKIDMDENFNVYGLM